MDVGRDFVPFWPFHACQLLRQIGRRKKVNTIRMMLSVNNNGNHPIFVKDLFNMVLIHYQCTSTMERWMPFRIRRAHGNTEVIPYQKVGGIKFIHFKCLSIRDSF